MTQRDDSDDGDELSGNLSCIFWACHPVRHLCSIVPLLEHEAESVSKTVTSEIRTRDMFA